MGNPSHFLSGFFKAFTKAAGNRKSETSKGNEKHARIKYPATLPKEICRQFSLTEIKAATNNFHPKSLVREGYFVKVYKGIVDYGNLVAVKRFKPDSVQGLDGFQTEVQLLCQLRHQNLVSLIGFCNDKDEKILVYELMKNGSLRDHLYGCNYDPLLWKQRLEICIGAARGLHYLHAGAKHAVIHRDIKSRNILLDDKWVSKLSSFFFSKMRPQPSYSSTSKALKPLHSEIFLGTLGYWDPEYQRDGGLSEKCDVYSFGVVLFEVLCARPVIDRRLDEHKQHLVYWVCRCIGDGTIYNIIDSYLKGKIAPECFKIFVDIAYCCISEKGDTRPEMGEVEMMLELALKMQEKADSEMKDVDPHGECTYGEVSFSIPVSDHSFPVDNSSPLESRW
ncbi:PREDICTED: receptor-like protein kinase FERONIA isoform X1 [Theobroma cacao]|uniref:Receptor-like protein kinase FERONIA isoform X1 n=1 Tax=Theobroma cacao TaxID=3641 RepID=A0AB32X1E0_THECC|nr:PREDICTED: receptor-like protein kinase FERONIA isoform X1 [Theobroma cacao]